MIRRLLPLIGLLAAGCRPEADPAAAAQVFFAQIATGSADAAFTGSAFSFQAKQSAREFAAAAREVGLIGASIVKAESPALDRRTAKMSTDFRAADGREFRLIVTLLHEAGAWRVFSAKAPMNIETGLSENRFAHFGESGEAMRALEHPVPDERAIQAMTKEAMLEFNDAIQQRSFEDFYENVARAWQRQLTLGMLARTFQGFIDLRTNLAAIRNVEAVLKEPPYMDCEGLLIVSGSYATKPHRVGFSLKFFYEMPNWRVFGLDVNLYH